ncbi:MAG TPA: lipocalin family protein [Acidimicrobiia bacterium]|nr:lipocalin family protein [Acidimicrobiia bacterium]
MRRLSTLVLALALVTAACGGDSEDATTSTTVDPATTTTAAPTTTEATEAETTTTDAVTTTAEAAGSGGPDCLEGTWILDNDSFVDALLAAFADSGMEAESLEPNDGTYTIDLSADGTFTGTRDDWGFSVVMPEGAFNITVNGTETGTWSADDDTITVTQTGSDISAAATVEADGQEFELPEAPVPIPEAMQTDSVYTCDDDTLTVTTEDVTTVMNRA